MILITKRELTRVYLRQPLVHVAQRTSPIYESYLPCVIPYSRLRLRHLSILHPFIQFVEKLYSPTKKHTAQPTIA